MTRWPTLRGIILFFAGLAGEVVLTVAWLKGTDPNQALMLLFATMMGLPVFLQRDEKSPLGTEQSREPPELPPDEQDSSLDRPRPGRRPRDKDKDRTW